MNYSMWREGDDGPVHLGPPDGNDYTLCGYALDGECDDLGDEPCHETRRGPVDCEKCICIVSFVRSLPRRVARPVPPQEAGREG